MTPFPRARRRPVRTSGPATVLVGVVGVVLATSMLSACNDDGAETTRSTPSSVPPTSSATSAPPVTPAPTPEPDPLDPLDWRTAFHVGEPYDLHRVGDGFVGVETRGASGLTADGEITWHWRPPYPNDTAGFVVGDDVVVMEPDVRKGDHEVVALDARTGKELWTQPSNGYATHDDEHVFVTTCVGRLDDPSGDCTMAAYDARSGAALWTSPLGTPTENTSVIGDRVLVEAVRDGQDDSYLLLDTATGSVVVEDLAPDVDSYVVYEIGDDRLAVVEEDLRPADGCRPTVALLDLAGTRLWERRLRTGLGCDEIYVTAAGDDVAVNGFFTSTTMLDGRTGTTLWHTRQQGATGPASAGVQVVDNDRERTTTGFDIRSGKVLWTAPVRVGGWDLSGRYLAGNVVCETGSCTVVLDIRSGTELATVAGVSQAFVPPRRPGGRVGMLTLIDSPESYRGRYGFVTLPRLP